MNRNMLKCTKYSFWVFAITPQLYNVFHFESIACGNCYCSLFLWCDVILWTWVCQFILIIHYVNLHFNWQTFATCLVHFMKWITVLDTLCQKSKLICVISDVNQVVHSNISSNIQFDRNFGQFGRTDSGGCYNKTMFMQLWICPKKCWVLGAWV